MRPGIRLLAVMAAFMMGCIPLIDVGSDDGPDCDDATWGQYNVLDHYYDRFSPPGCSTDASVPPLQGSIEMKPGQRMVMRVRREDGSPFPAGLLTLYVGVGPACKDPPNVPKAVEAADEGKVEQFLELALEEVYDATTWREGQTKQFWVRFEDAATGGFSATSMVLVERVCVP